VKALVPWHARIAAKIVLSRLPAGYGLWRRLNLFSHGLMDQADYAYKVFTHHFGRTALPSAARSFVALELGPGDSAVSAVVAAAHGADRVHLVDAGAFATRDLQVYQDMAAFLARRGLSAPDLSGVRDLEDVLARCHAEYGTRGLESLRAVPSASVDFAWSQAVLEHVRRGELLETMRELRRVLKPDGLASHVVDLKDHLGGALNNMRLPSRLWEAEWMARSGFYTNRVRMGEMLDIFHAAGFHVEVQSTRRWDAPPTDVSLLAAEFQALGRDEFLVQEFDVLLRPV
jgi:SAM-dependent methyltransferase